MKFSIKLAIAVTTLSTALGCSSLHTKINKVKLGTFKRQALSKFGEPTEKYRSNGQDHWIYETQKKSKQGNEPIVYQHILIFEEGQMIKKRTNRSFTSRELETYYEKN